MRLVRTSSCSAQTRFLISRSTADRATFNCLADFSLRSCRSAIRRSWCSVRRYSFRLSRLQSPSSCPDSARNAPAAGRGVASAASTTECNAPASDSFTEKKPVSLVARTRASAPTNGGARNTTCGCRISGINRSERTNCPPSMSGNSVSTRIRSGRSTCATLSPRRPIEVSITSWPASRRDAAAIRRFIEGPSTIRIRAMICGE